MPGCRFFLSHMKISINNTIFNILLVFVALLCIGCEKEYRRPDHYKVDLFADERQKGEAYVMNRTECFDTSDMVISTSAVKLTDSSKGRGKPVYIYKVNNGELLKTTRDSVVEYPLQFLSPQRLKLRKDSSVYVYLKKLEGYRFLAKEKDLNYQWLKGAPVYSVQKDK